MLINKDTLLIPSVRDLEGALFHFYAPLVNAPYEEARCYVLPEDPDFQKNPEPGFWYVEAEIKELNCILKSYAFARQSAKDRNDFAMVLRMMLMEYLALLEADFPAFAILNALRYYRKKRPVPKFLNGTDTVCKLAREKFKEIASQAKMASKLAATDEERQHALVLVQAFPVPCLKKPSKGLFLGLLRNAVAHAHFRVQNKTKESAVVYITRDYSFLTRTAKKESFTGARGMCAIYTYDAIEKLLKAAEAYANQCIELFNQFCRKQRNPDLRATKWKNFQSSM